jgi:hypothetical protein
MKFKHKNYIRIAITVYTSVTTLYYRKRRLKEDGFLLILHVMRLSNRSGNLFWTSTEHAYKKLSFKSLAIMAGLKNNLHQGRTNSGLRFARVTKFFCVGA